MHIDRPDGKVFGDTGTDELCSFEDLDIEGEDAEYSDWDIEVKAAEHLEQRGLIECPKCGDWFRHLELYCPASMSGPAEHYCSRCIRRTQYGRV